ncbi:hypothetical protein TNIN_412211 [Trichonephila inaurata madagascariensis]|uniref:Uncharacterized protein n=1 Tax=Trichonephila inaurata madagascariensis TaxID=2747483 RepID=A0A8X6YVB5_9ARAC|nr:hypothetical protein TNIN_412211 [Trichonephila inaurata madagascariensis]
MQLSIRIFANFLETSKLLILNLINYRMILLNELNPAFTKCENSIHRFHNNSGKWHSIGCEFPSVTIGLEIKVEISIDDFDNDVSRINRALELCVSSENSLK